MDRSWLLSFFFSSRRRHTRYIGDWSSDVCSSDLSSAADAQADRDEEADPAGATATETTTPDAGAADDGWETGVAGGDTRFRSEERRVGKECRSRWSPGR